MVITQLSSGEQQGVKKLASCNSSMFRTMAAKQMQRQWQSTEENQPVHQLDCRSRKYKRICIVVLFIVRRLLGIMKAFDLLKLTKAEQNVRTEKLNSLQK